MNWIKQFQRRFWRSRRAGQQRRVGALAAHLLPHAGTSRNRERTADDARSIGVQSQAIAVGTRIDRVGMTGRTTSLHLHWGLKYNGNWVNPALVLRAMYAGKQATASTPQ